MTEEQLAELIRTQPEKGLELTIIQYGGLVKTVLLRVLYGREQDIEDCMGTVFCRVWQQIERFDPEKGSFKSWICRLARNCAIDLRRREGEELLPLDSEALGANCDLTDEAARRINAAIVRQTLNAMDEPDRTIFLRRYYDLARVRVIAEELDMTEKAVERRLAGGRERLRNELLRKGVILE